MGSGIAAQRLSPSDVGLQLFENAAATAMALVAIILALGPVSGAHLNPVITLVDRVVGGASSKDAAAYCAAQVLGGASGTIVANLMFSAPAVRLSPHVRAGGGIFLGEVVATFGLVLIVIGLVRTGRAATVPFAVGAYIGAAYFFTSSTSFANPAAALARSLTNTFAGIAPRSVPAFVAAELLGGSLGLIVARGLFPQLKTDASSHPSDRSA